MALDTKVMYEFGRFRLDPDQHLLTVDQRPVPLTPKSFDLLLVLIQSGGRLLTKDELMKKLWPDSFVEEANLSVNISALRKALGDSTGGQELIETVPKHGYRFKSIVIERPSDVPGNGGPRLIHVSARTPANGGTSSSVPEVVADLPLAAHLPASRPHTHRLGSITLAAVLFVATAGIIFTFYVRHRAPAPRPVAAATPELHRLAILPFQNLRHDPESDFLGYSLADVVITKLGYLSSLSVTPSAAIQRYRNQAIEIQKVAADLDVDTLLTGSFVRDGDDLRITYQLIDARAQKILGRGTIDLKYDKLLKVQDTVSQEIIGALELNLSPGESERIRTDAPVNPVAYEYYLRGLDLYGRHDFPLAIKMFEKSLEMDANYPLTWAYLGASYTSDAAFKLGGREQYRKARSAYERALRIQPTQLEAHLFLANLLIDNGRVEQAVPLLRDALRTNPNRADLHWELGYAYRFAGMLRESVEECELARRLDPLVRANGAALNTYLYLGQYGKFLSSLPDDNDTAFIVFYRGFGEYHLKQWDAAARDFERANNIDPTLYTQIGKAFSDSISHKDTDGITILHSLEKKIAERGVGDPEATYKMAEAYAVLGERPAATRMLRTSIENGFFPYPYFQTDPLIDSVRSVPAFPELMRAAEQRHDEFKRKFF